MTIEKSKLLNFTPIILGTISFLLVVGPTALHPRNIAWLSQGDPAQHYLGWLFFRNSEWSFPIGLNPSYGLELSNSIVFSDSIPLLAFLFKPFSPLLATPFQYFGIWFLVCFILQAWFAWKLIGLISDSLAIRAFGAGLFVFSPPMISRMMQGHLSLVGHFLIIAALYLAFQPRLDRRILMWSLLLAAASLVHAYLLAMIAVIWFSDLAGKTIDNSSVRSCLLEIFTIFTVTGIACWQAGYFTVGQAVSSFGFGFYRMNLLSIIDSNNWSYLLKNIPGSRGDNEGFNYLGLGVIFISILSIPILLIGEIGIKQIAYKYRFICLGLFVLFLFALSNKIGFGSIELIEYPYRGSRFANTFRSSGRMFWPVFYVIYFVVIFVIIRGTGKRTGAFLLGLALFIQIVDTSAGWRNVSKKLDIEPGSAWVTPLVNPFWECAASRYRKVRWILPAHRLPPEWQAVASYAGNHGLATDAALLARVGTSALEQANRQAVDALRTGKYEADSLYFLDDNSFREAVRKVDHSSNLVSRIDAFNIIAPGQINCLDGH
jgi:hypothetical protein